MPIQHHCVHSRQHVHIIAEIHFILHVRWDTSESPPNNKLFLRLQSYHIPSTWETQTLYDVVGRPLKLLMKTHLTGDKTLPVNDAIIVK